MSETAPSKSDVQPETSIPPGGTSLGSILCTEELHRRPSRPPDYGKENSALVALVSALADSPRTILQTLTETILEITQSDSAGVSLLTTDEGGKRFYWPAIAGMWNAHIGGGLPHDFAPCGDVINRNCTLLFTQVAALYPILRPVIPVAEELLCVPFYVGGRAVGTIWAIMHSDGRKFDGEDERVMGSLAKFASSAYQAVMSIDDLKFQVAEREKAEAAVRELANGLEAKFRCLVDANIMGIFIWNLEGRIVEANEAFLHIVEYDREDLVSGCMRWRDLTPAEWHDRDKLAEAELMASGSIQPFEKEYLRKDGSRVPVLAGGALFKEGRNEGVGFALDLSEQKRAEEALRRSEGYLTEAQRLSRTGSFAWDVRTGAIFWSQEIFRICDYDPVKIKPTWSNWLDRIHPEDRPKMIERRAKAESTRKELRVDPENDFRIVLPDGTIKYLHTISHPVMDEAGEITEVIGTVMDVTERMLADQERERLRQALADLAHLDRVSTMGELTASLAHEIKQPMFAAAADAETCLRWLERAQPDVAEAQQAALRLMKDVSRASDIINRIVSLFKKDVPQREFVNVNGVIQEVIALLHSEASRYSVSIDTDLSDGLPNVMAERVGLQQVLMNLMLNAIQAMKELGAPGKLTITTRENENRQILVSVSDTGGGLPSGQTEQIFTAFFTSKPQGTGMGLPISRSIIESHGGRLWAIPSSARGATFQFTLPLEAVSHQSA